VWFHERVLEVLRERGGWMSAYDLVFAISARTGEVPSRATILRAIILLLAEGKVEVKKQIAGTRIWMRFRAKEEGR